MEWRTKARFTLEHVLVGVLIRVVADAADRGGQEAHFRDDVQRCRAHVLDKAERHRAGPGPGPRTSTVRDGRATTTTTTTRARTRGRLARTLGALGALLARARRTATSGPIDVRKPRGLTDLGELAKSCRPWAADSGTSLSPDDGGGGGGGGGYS